MFTRAWTSPVPGLLLQPVDGDVTLHLDPKLDKAAVDTFLARVEVGGTVHRD